MQGRLMCERGADGHARESWWFCFNEQLTHLFDPKNRKWTVVPPGGQQFKGTLDNDEELTKLLWGHHTETVRAGSSKYGSTGMKRR